MRTRPSTLPLKCQQPVLACLLLALWVGPSFATPEPTIVPAPKLDVPVSVSDAEARRNTKPITLAKIILVGDSTVQVGSGWGGAFCANHVTGFVACVNLARGGRSTLSYQAEGSWANALNEAKVPGYTATYVLIQFGHNDQPGKPGRSTDLDSEFPQNLRSYVAQARAAGAIPILVTPLTRRSFVKGSLLDTLSPWARQTIQVATEMNVPVIDLHASSMRTVQEMGPVASLQLAQAPPPPEVVAAARSGTSLGASLPSATPSAPRNEDATTRKSPQGANFDYTHLGAQGAELFASQVAEALLAVAPSLRGQVKP